MRMPRFGVRKVSSFSQASSPIAPSEHAVSQGQTTVYSCGNLAELSADPLN